MADRGIRPNEQALNPTENRRIRTDAEGECENGDDGEARGFAQHAEAEAQVLEQILKPADAARVATFLLGLFDAAEFDESGAASFLQAHALGDVGGGLLGDVIAELVVKVGIGAATVEEGA